MLFRNQSMAYAILSEISVTLKSKNDIAVYLFVKFGIFEEKKL